MNEKAPKQSYKVTFIALNFKSHQSQIKLIVLKKNTISSLLYNSFANLCRSGVSAILPPSIDNLERNSLIFQWSFINVHNFHMKLGLHRRR